MPWRFVSMFQIWSLHEPSGGLCYCLGPYCSQKAQLLNERSCAAEVATGQLRGLQERQDNLQQDFKRAKNELAAVRDELKGLKVCQPRIVPRCHVYSPELCNCVARPCACTMQGANER